MKEYFQWGDTDGNNGYSYNEFTPAELQAAWELQGMPFIAWGEDTGERRGRLEVGLSEGGPSIGLIPNQIDAKTIQAAIQIRAALLEASGQSLNPPTIDQIREQLQERIHAR